MFENRKAGIIFISVNGRGYQPKGSFKYGLGTPARSALISSSGNVIGYKSTATTPFIEGEIFDSKEISLSELQSIENSTATLSLANGKSIVLQNCWFASQNGIEGNTEEGTITFRLEGLSAVEITND